MEYTIKAACLSHAGKVRSANEDNFCFAGEYMPIDHSCTEKVLSVRQSSKTGPLFGVFDGMGGENYGEVASYIAAKASAKTNSLSLNSRETMENHAQVLNGEVVHEANERLTRHMGTTMVMMLFYNDKTFLCNVGDSKAFQFRKQQLQQISTDHLDGLSALMGDIKRKPSLSQYIGVDPEEFMVDPYTAEFDIYPGDRYLICSDGLTDMVSSDAISQILRNSNSPESCARSLIDAALKGGGKDNITVIVCEVA